MTLCDGIAQVTPCWANVTTCDFTWRKDLVTGEVEQDNHLSFHYISINDGLCPVSDQGSDFFAGGMGAGLWQTPQAAIFEFSSFNFTRPDIKFKVSQTGQRLSNLSGSFSGWQSVSGWLIPKLAQMSLRLITEVDFFSVGFRIQF